MFYTICFCKLAKLSATVLQPIVCYGLGDNSMFAKKAFHMIYYGKGSGARQLPNDRELAIMVIQYYIITQVILAFALVLAFDVLEDRRTIDVIVTKIFPPCFKMAEGFENLDNILHDWAKDKVQKSIAEALNRFEKPENER